MVSLIDDLGIGLVLLVSVTFEPSENSDRLPFGTKQTP